MSAAGQLYMFAIIPPPDLAAKIHTERINFAEEYRCIKGLKPPVHITLFKPFTLLLSEAIEFETNIPQLQTWADRQTPFRISLNNYSFFDDSRKPVLFIDVVGNQQLVDLHHGFITELKKYYDPVSQNDTYKPHITIGYRDIDPTIFPSIKADYSHRKFQASFDCRAFYLWKHNGNNWEVHWEFRLNGIEQPGLF